MQGDLVRLTKNQITKPLKEADRTTNIKIGQVKRIAFSRLVPGRVLLMMTATPGESINFTKDIPKTAFFSLRSLIGINKLLPKIFFEYSTLGNGEGSCSVRPFLKFLKSSGDKMDSQLSTTWSQISGRIPLKSTTLFAVVFVVKMSGFFGHHTRVGIASKFEFASMEKSVKTITIISATAFIYQEKRLIPTWT